MDYSIILLNNALDGGIHEFVKYHLSNPETNRPANYRRALGEIAKRGDLAYIKQILENLGGDPDFSEACENGVAHGVKFMMDLQSLGAPISDIAYAASSCGDLKMMVFFQDSQLSQEDVIRSFRKAISRGHIGMADKVRHYIDTSQIRLIDGDKLLRSVVQSSNGCAALSLIQEMGVSISGIGKEACASALTFQKLDLLDLLKANGADVSAAIDLFSFHTAVRMGSLKALEWLKLNALTFPNRADLDNILERYRWNIQNRPESKAAYDYLETMLENIDFDREALSGNGAKERKRI